MNILHWLDWTVLSSTLLFIVVYGIIKSRGSKNIEGYLLGDNTMKWGTIGLSVMATQASAITFLSTPGQAYESGMGFIQNYFGMPFALIIVSAVFIPIYYKLKVFTAYEYLEKRFDIKTRLLGAFLFLMQRGLGAGITIYAPAIILSSLLGWNLQGTIIVVGVLVVVYTVSGGSKAVSITQKYQMAVIMAGMFTAFFIIIFSFPDSVTFPDAINVAGKMGKLEALDFSFDFSKRYTIWSGIFGGIFLSLSYFGTDQSQVQRYLTGKNTAESRMGLMFNAILKIPMQFFILFVGVMVFIFYQFEKPPVHFKTVATNALLKTEYAEDFKDLDAKYTEVFDNKKEEIKLFVKVLENGDEAAIEDSKNKVLALDQEGKDIRDEVKYLLAKSDPEFDPDDYDLPIDSDYVFLTFIITWLPKGVIGLLLAVILSAAMSSTSAELNALGSTTTIDFYKRIFKRDGSDEHYLISSKVLTALWGVIAILFALFAQLLENLIQAVNIVGSLAYGTILGIFLTAFFVKSVKGNAVFIAAVIAEILVLVVHFMNTTGIIKIGFLWYNPIGCLLVIFLSYPIQKFFKAFWRQGE